MKAERGFSLIELAMVFIVVGMLAGGGLLSVNSLRKSNARKQTVINLNKINDALTLFVLHNKRLPCPSADTNGIERTPVCSGSDAFGFVPWKTLGIARAKALDGWSRFISYASDSTLSDNISPLILECTNDNLQTNAIANIDVKDGNDSSPADQKSKAAYVLISHGENGLGAVKSSGIAYAETPTLANQPQEWQNTSAGSSTVFYYEAINNIGFDDIVRFRSPAKILLDTGCKFVADVYEDTGGVPPIPEYGQITFTDYIKDFIGTKKSNKNQTEKFDIFKEGKLKIQTMVLGGNKGIYRTCAWWPDSIELSEKSIRAYFKFSITEDISISGEKGHGFTFAFLAGERTINNLTCGGIEEAIGYLGIENPKFAVELDTFSNQDGVFYDSDNNHAAIVFNNNVHTNDDGPRCLLEYEGDDVAGVGIPSFGSGCYPAPEQNWLESGIADYHQMRVEVHSPEYASSPEYSDAGNTCFSENKPYIKAWIWENGEECSNCDNLDSNFSTAPTIAWCLPESETYQDGVMFGFTQSSTNSLSTIRLQNFGLGSYDNY
ncbi:MAG: hypothetical protein KAJ75_06220 [Alphaproteobacteria bacterium]|nr:hypothetical protein [Alphaproteobacteria bacterium]